MPASRHRFALPLYQSFQAISSYVSISYKFGTVARYLPASHTVSDINRSKMRLITAIYSPAKAAR